MSLYHRCRHHLDSACLMVKCRSGARRGGMDTAVLNTPLISGDSLFTGPGANTEIQIGAHTHLRMGTPRNFR